MNHTQIALSAGLYLVATPIGNARDITLRALDVLASADILVAEDTRTLLKLMQIHGISRGGRATIAYHDHSGPSVATRLAAEIAEGRSVAYTSEAGSPLVSDPGHGLVAAMGEAGLPVIAVPGASAAITALTVAGLPTDRFLFLGFPPTKQVARRDWLQGLVHRPETMILYESPRRLAGLLEDVATVLGADHRVVMCRELTKKFETIIQSTASELAQTLKESPPKGECVLLLAGTSEAVAQESDIDAALLHAFERLSMKDAVKEVAQSLNLPRKQVYQIALQLRKNDEER